MCFSPAEGLGSSPTKLIYQMWGLPICFYCSYPASFSLLYLGNVRWQISYLCKYRSSDQEMKHLNNYICKDVDYKILDFEPDVRIVVVVQSLSHVWLYATPWTVVCQAPLSMGFFRQEYWCGLPFLAPGDLPRPGIEPASPASAGRICTIWATREAPWFNMSLKPS